MNQLFRLYDLEKKIKLCVKNLNKFDHKFTDAAPTLFNVRITSLEHAFETHTQQCTNYTMAAPNMVNV